MSIIRIWSYQLLPYLPDAQFKGQLRELVAIMRDWRDKGTTNHLLINRVMDYPKSELTKYYMLYDSEYQKRYGKFVNRKYLEEFVEFAPAMCSTFIYADWHNKEYLRVCVCNLYEKAKIGKGKNKINDDEWNNILIGYKAITGEEYVI